MVITPDIAKNIVDISRQTSRQIGIIVNRRGLIEYVIVGDRTGIEIPPLTTIERAGRARLKGIRFIHTHLNGELLSREDLSDLALLQLDLVLCITGRPGEGKEVFHAGYLVPDGKREWDFIGPLQLDEGLNIDFTEFVTELENEFVRVRGSLYSVRGDMERAILVIVIPPNKTKELDDVVMELKDLCYSAGIAVVDTIIQRPKELHPKYFVGKGKMEEISMRSQRIGADLLIFDEGLSPTQMKNIALLTDLKVIDRNQLILDIFAQRANTEGARIQVELAQLNYILPRLTEKNTAFSRLTGGIGGRGPGETKLETDKRRVKQRIAFLERRLEDIKKIRDRKRYRRKKSLIPTVSIIGYTDSGKSTLMNLLTKSSVEVGARAFSTLAPTARLIKYPERKEIVLTDTVGFIRELPDVILRAFMATLEELEDADLFLHLVDISAPSYEERIRIVDDILSALNLNDKKRIMVFNKIDRIERDVVEMIEGRYRAVAISCVTEEGIDRLIKAIELSLSG